MAKSGKTSKKTAKFKVGRVEFKDGINFGIKTNLRNGSAIRLETNKYNMKISKSTMNAFRKSAVARVIIQTVRDRKDIFDKPFEPRSNNTTGNRDIDLVQTGEMLSSLKANVPRQSEEGRWDIRLLCDAVTERKQRTHGYLRRNVTGRTYVNYGYVLMFGRNAGEKKVRWQRLSDERTIFVAKYHYPAAPARAWCGFDTETAKDFLNQDLLPVLSSLCFQLSIIPFYKLGHEYKGTAEEETGQEIVEVWKNANNLQKQAKNLIESKKKNVKIYKVKKVL